MPEKKAIASFIIGAVGIISLFLNVTSFGFFPGELIWKRILDVADNSKLPQWFSKFIFLSFIYIHFLFIFVFFLSIVGIFLGIKGRKSSKKKIAILGIILCCIDLIFSLYIGYWWLIILTPR
jgi:hypothetical protein